MKIKSFLSKRAPALALAVVAAVCLLLAVLIHSIPGYTFYAYAPYSFYILQPDEVTEQNIPEYAGISRTYTFTLPEGSAATIGARLSFYLRHTTAQVHIEDTELYYDSSENDTPHVGHTTGNYWVTVPVRPAYAGKTVHITLTPVFESVADEEPVFWLIGHEQLLNMILLPQDALLLCLSIFAIIAGILMSVFVLILPLDRAVKHRTLLLGLIAIAAGLWKLSGLSSVALMTDSLGRHKEIWYAGAVSYLFMLTVSLLYLTIIQKKDGRKIGRICYYLCAGAAFLLVLLQLMNVIELHDCLIWFGITVAVLHFIALAGHRPSAAELLWVLPLFFALGVDLLFYGLSGSMQRAPFFLIWSAVSLIVRAISFVRGAILSERLLAQREAELRETRIRAMIQQIRPHFIYNTLTSIYVLIKEDPERAMTVVQDFTDYLQSNFTAISADKPISFSDELKHTQAYLAVESMRYGDELHVKYDTAFTAFRLPALTLQPIVENAVKYGVGKGHSPEHITIATRAGQDASVIIVTDDGPGFDPNESNTEAHTGIENVRERLAAMCGGSVEIESVKGSGTSVVIRIPSQS